jgi:TonB family protein
MYGRTNYFSYHLKRVLLAHIIIIVLLFAYWGVSILINKIKKKPPLAIPINFVVTPAQKNVETVKKAIIPPVEDVSKVPPVKKTYKPEIKISKKKVVRGEKKPEVQPKKITEEQLRKELASVINTTSYTISDDQKNMVRIRNALYQAWQQPSKEAVGDDHVTLEISFDANGNIISRKLIRSSDNKILDESVLYGASKVNSIPGLTKEFLKRNKKVTILFRVE